MQLQRSCRRTLRWLVFFSLDAPRRESFGGRSHFRAVWLREIVRKRSHWNLANGDG